MHGCISVQTGENEGDQSIYICWQIHASDARHESNEVDRDQSYDEFLCSVLNVTRGGGDKLSYVTIFSKTVAKVVGLHLSNQSHIKRA